MSWIAALTVFYAAAAISVLWDCAQTLADRLVRIADYTRTPTDLQLAGLEAQVGTTNRNQLTVRRIDQT